jgi:hypothetical protein
MSLLSPHGYQLSWQFDQYTRTRAECPRDGDSHARCGLVWSNIPGIPKGLIEIRPEKPHYDRGAWLYDISIDGKTEVMGTGLAGLVATQHAMVHRVPYLMKGRPWVVGRIVTDASSGAWKATLQLGEKIKVLEGEREGTIEATLLTGVRELLAALKRPVCLKLTEPSGALRVLYDGGIWPRTGGRVGALMAQVEALALPHFVRLRGSEKGS